MLSAPLAGSGLAFALVDADGAITVANAVFAEMLASEGARLGGRRLDGAVIGTSLDRRCVAEVVAGRRRRYTLETRLRRDDGSDFWASLTLTPAGEGDGAPAALVLLDDTSERRRLDEEQKALRDQLGTAASEWRATFDAIDMPIFILGTDGRADRLNRAARDLAGREFADLLGLQLSEMADGPLWEEADRLVERARDERHPIEAEVFDEESGRTWLLAASSGVPDLSAARPMILTVRELTGLVQLQESLRRSETMAAMGSLVGGVAHEVRNPLFGISAVIDALERRVEDREELAGHLGYLRRDVGRLEKLMADLLDFGRPVVPEPEPLPLARVVDDALLACVRQLELAGVSVERRVEEPPTPVLLDRHRVARAVVNLIENAAHHAPRGSRLEIVVETLERSGRRWSQLTVRDHGPGFGPADLPRLFEPFFSRRTGGTGLGLPIVVQIVEGHGGEVEAANATGGGAVVRLRFPLLEEPATRQGEVR